MKNNESWKSFINSGRIDDYLHYVACTREEVSEEPIKGIDSSMRKLLGSARSEGISLQSKGVSL